MEHCDSLGGQWKLQVWHQFIGTRVFRTKDLVMTLMARVWSCIWRLLFFGYDFLFQVHETCLPKNYEETSKMHRILGFFACLFMYRWMYGWGIGIVKPLIWFKLWVWLTNSTIIFCWKLPFLRLFVTKWTVSIKKWINIIWCFRYRYDHAEL